MWVRPWRCGCLVTWFCYQLIAKPGKKTATPAWAKPYASEAQQNIISTCSGSPAVHCWSSQYPPPPTGCQSTRWYWSWLSCTGHRASAASLAPSWCASKMGSPSRADRTGPHQQSRFGNDGTVHQTGSGKIKNGWCRGVSLYLNFNRAHRLLGDLNVILKM